jgi:hypothetical protein
MQVSYGEMRRFGGLDRVGRRGVGSSTPLVRSFGIRDLGGKGARSLNYLGLGIKSFGIRGLRAKEVQFRSAA